jgi:hypothetical protein
MDKCSPMDKLQWWITRGGCGFDCMMDMYEEEDFCEGEED